MNYPKFETLNIAPDFLTFGAMAIKALKDKGWLTEARALPASIPPARREYNSVAGRRKAV